MTIGEFIKEHRVTADEWAKLRGVLILRRLRRLEKATSVKRFFGGKDVRDEG